MFTLCILPFTIVTLNFLNSFPFKRQILKMQYKFALRQKWEIQRHEKRIGIKV